MRWIFHLHNQVISSCLNEGMLGHSGFGIWGNMPFNIYVLIDVFKNIVAEDPSWSKTSNHGG